MQRKTLISLDDVDIKIDQEVLIPKEEVVTLITKDGYIKRTSKRAYLANTEEAFVKEQDYVIGLFFQSTLDTVLLFTNLGNYLYLPVYEIPDIKWKTLGKHISNIIKLEEQEQIVAAIPIKNFDVDSNIVIASKNGMIKKTSVREFKVSRYSKPISCMKLKENDSVISAFVAVHSDIMVVTKHGSSLWFDVNEIPDTGIKSAGVKSITLKNDEVVSALNFAKDQEYVIVITDKGSAKRVRLEEFEKQVRTRKGLTILKEVKTNPYCVLCALMASNKDYIGIKTIDSIETLKATEIPISDRYKTGSTIVKKQILEAFVICQATSEVIPVIEDKPKVNEQISLLEIDDELKKIDDMLK